MRGELVAWGVRGIAVAAGVALVYGLASIAVSAGGVLLLVFVAILLASALEPFVGWIRGHIGLGRGPTILLVYAAFFVAVIAMALVIVPAAIAQFQETVAGLPPIIDRARVWAAGLRPAPLSAGVKTLIDAAKDLLSPPPPDPS